MILFFILPIFIFADILIASVLKLSIGMSEEYHASRIVFEYLEQHYEKLLISMPNFMKQKAYKRLVMLFYQMIYNKQLD